MVIFLFISNSQLSHYLNIYHTKCPYFRKRLTAVSGSATRITTTLLTNSEGNCMSFKIGRAGLLPQSGLAAFADDDDDDSMQQDLKGAQAESQRLKVQSI